MIKISILGILFAISGHVMALAQTSETTIRDNLCTRSLCEQRWSDAYLRMCSMSTNPEPGKDFVWDTFVKGKFACVCPCNWPKYFR